MNEYKTIEDCAEKCLLRSKDPTSDERTKKFYKDLFDVARALVSDLKKIDESIEYKRLREEIVKTLGRWGDEFELLINKNKQ